jgi:hypothetical protein
LRGASEEKGEDPPPSISLAKNYKHFIIWILFLCVSFSLSQNFDRAGSEEKGKASLPVATPAKYL